MYYDDFVNELKKMITTKQTFQTLKQDKEFDAVYSQGDIIITPLSTGEERLIQLNEFFKIWNLVGGLSKQERYNPSNYQQDTYNSSYILTLIHHILKDDEIEKLSH